MNRCPWCLKEQIYIDYHDNEWGIPKYDDRVLFEALLLDGAQAGLSWITILKKRENYRAAFENFDPIKIASFDENKIKLLLSNQGIVRNRLKITSFINNSKVYLNNFRENGSFTEFLWSFVGNKPIINHFETMSEVPAKTDISDTISNKLKKLGFSFVGSTICYAFMQAVGMVNDHLLECYNHNIITKNL